MRKIISLILILILTLTSFSGCVKKNKEESIETDSSNKNHISSDFGSNGWHKYRIRNKN